MQVERIGTRRRLRVSDEHSEIVQLERLTLRAGQVS